MKRLFTSPTRLLQLFCFLVFAGRAWQFLVWDAPFRTLLWDQAWMEGVVNFFGMSWQEYATSLRTDLMIQLTIRATGVYFVLCAVATLLVTKPNRFIRVFVALGSIPLFLLALLYCKEKFFHVSQFVEYASQFCAPVFLYLLVGKEIDLKKLVGWMKVAVALTFVAHGLYALGYYPRPGVFVDMVINTFGVSEAFAHAFIWWAGVLDLIVAVMLFVPQATRFALLYTCVWGFVTAGARYVGAVDFNFFWDTTNQYLLQTLYRLVHGGLPLVAFLLVRSFDEQKGEASEMWYKSFRVKYLFQW